MTPEQYQEARQAGYTDEQILAHFGVPADKGQEALQAGHSVQDIVAYFSANAAPAAPAATPQMEGPLRDTAMSASSLLHGFVQLAGTPGNVEALASHYIPRSGELLNAVVNPLGAAVSSILPTAPRLLPTSQDLLGITSRYGLTDNPSLAPGSPMENYEASLFQGIGSTVPLALASGGTALLPTLLSGGAGGLSSEWARQAGGNEWEQFGAGLLGGSAVGGLASAGTRLANLALGRVTPTARNFLTAKLPLRSAALVSESPRTVNALAPFAPVEQTQGDLSTSLTGTANGLGNSTTLQQAGTYAQDRARDWLANTLPAKEAAAWDPVDKAIPGATPTPITNLTGALQAMTSKGGTLARAVQKLQPVLPAQIYKSIQTSITNLTGGSPTWADVRSLRSAIGTAMSDPSIAPKAGAQNLSTMYAAITQDLARTAKAQGASDLFTEANTESSRLHNFVKNIVSKIISGKTAGAADNPVPEKVAASFLNPSSLRKGGSALAELNTELPDVTNEFAAAHLHGLANLDPSVVGTGATTVSKALLKSLGNLSPEARIALFNSAQARTRLTALEQVAGKVPTAATATPAAAQAGSHGLAGAAGAFALGGVHNLLGGHPIDLATLAELAGGVSTLGTVAGASRNAVLNSLANSSAVARYSASLPPGWVIPGQVPVAAATGTAGNLLGP